VFIATLVLRYALLKKLRLILTLVGIVAAIAAFGLLRSVLSAWQEGINVHSAMRLVTHHASSLAIALPIAYQGRIRRVDGVEAITPIQWFNGSFGESREFFPKFAVDGPGYFAVYPEIRLSEVERTAFLTDRTGCLIGNRLAERFSLKTGDILTLQGAKYRGLWRFTVRGVFHADSAQQEWQMLFHWSLLNETIRARTPHLGNKVGAYVSLISDPAKAEEIAQQIDQLFINTPDATRSESEDTFLLGFLYSAEAIFGVIGALSFLVIFTILLVVSNTMLMSARERYREYATLKAIGFGPLFIGGLIIGESVLIAVCGGLLGILATYPLTRWFEALSGGLIPVVSVSSGTQAEQLIVSVIVGVAGGVLPSWIAVRRRVADSLRNIG
jgi:putative ABC transport system permease protein